MMMTMIDRGAARPRHALVGADRRRATFAAGRRTKDRLHVVRAAAHRLPDQAGDQAPASPICVHHVVQVPAWVVADLRVVHRWLAAEVECGVCRLAAKGVPSRLTSGWCGLSASSTRFSAS